MAGGDIDFRGIAAVDFRDGFILDGYGTVRFTDCRNIISLRSPVSGVTGQVLMVNVWSSGPVIMVGRGGRSLFANCHLGDITLSYPAAGPTLFTNCSLGMVSIDHAGAAPSGVQFLHCVMSGYTTDAFATEQWLLESMVNGNVNANGLNSRIENNRVSGTFSAPFTDTFHTATSGDTTPSVSGRDWLTLANATATIVTNLDDGTPGQRVTLMFTNGSTTLRDAASGGSFQLANGVNFIGTVDDTLTVIRRGTIWYEVGRSVN